MTARCPQAIRCLDPFHVVAHAENLTPSQQRKLAWVQRVNQPLYRAYLLKKHLRLVFQLPFVDALDLLAEWLDWAVRSHLQLFVDVAHCVAEHIEALIAEQEHRLSNAPRSTRGSG